VKLACLDVDYRADRTVTACLSFEGWEAAAPSGRHAFVSAAAPADYEPGAFFRRELPYLLDALERVGLPDVVIIDGYVWLAPGRPGLGARLDEALGGRCEVVGVAKRPFHGSDAVPVLRGESAVPLWVTAVRGDPVEVAARVKAMHGAWRLPTLLKEVDRLARDFGG
jgi:deoxyribonuclease V